VEEGVPGGERGHWPRYLQGEDSAEILAHLCNGDPLRLFERVATRLRETWYLLDPDRVHRRALAVCANAAAVELPPADVETWKVAKIDRAIAELVRADREAERDRPEVVDEEANSFPMLTECLLLEPDLVRPCVVAFHELGELPRRAFFELVVEGREVEACVEGGPWDEDGLYVAIHEALGALGLDLLSASPEVKEKGKTRKRSRKSKEDRE